VTAACIRHEKLCHVAASSGLTTLTTFRAVLLANDFLSSHTVNMESTRHTNSQINSSPTALHSTIEHTSQYKRVRITPTTSRDTAAVKVDSLNNDQ
jgi:hypothetical protein